MAELKSHLKTKSDGVRKLSQTPSIRRSRLNGQQMGFGSDEADDEADGFRMEFENMRNLVRTLLTCTLFLCIMYILYGECYCSSAMCCILWLDVNLM